MRLADILDANDPDLSRFSGHGGKLIMYVGTADALISPRAGIDYYGDLLTRMGASRAKAFTRLFVIPGMQHCQGGLTPNAFGQAWVAPAMKADSRYDIRLALEAWVERDRAPASLTAAKYHDASSEKASASRLLLPYSGH